MVSKKILNKIIDIEVELSQNLTEPAFVKLVGDLLKHILLQRNQIPLQYDIIQKEVASSRTESVEESDDSGYHDSSNSREAVRNRRKAARHEKARRQLVERGARLLEEVEMLLSLLQTELGSGAVSSISFLLGATPHSAREVWTVEVPAGLLVEQDPAWTGKVAAGPGLALLRALLQHEEVARLAASRLPVSNTFTAICRRSPPVSLPGALVPLPAQFCLPAAGRAARVRVRPVPPPPHPATATRRLRFSSGPAGQQPRSPEVDGRQDAEHSPSKQRRSDPLSPDSRDCKGSRDLCTPAPPPRRNTALSTPALVTRSSVMELCTPVPRPHSSLVPWTPALASASSTNSNMVLCTPAPSLPPNTPAPRLYSKMLLSTPAPAPVNMLLCTPAPPPASFADNMVLCTPAPSDPTSMELCTPAPPCSYRQPGPALDLSPGLAMLSVVEESDSTSNGESSSEYCHWNVTQDPIRGFKYNP